MVSLFPFFDASRPGWKRLKGQRSASSATVCPSRPLLSFQQTLHHQCRYTAAKLCSKPVTSSAPLIAHRTPILWTLSFIPCIKSGRLRSSFVNRRRKQTQKGRSAKRTRSSVRWKCSEQAFIVGVQEALELLLATTIVIPVFRRLNLSPILGFLLAGVVLGPHGLRLVKDVEDITELADFGILFLLFEMGLELSLDRLARLRKYAFGLGFLQMVLTSLILGLGAYAMGANAAEAAVVGSALSLSSSAFVLQLLAERGERQSRAGVATFGVLLLQDIAIVPLLVLVPFLGTAHWFPAGDLSAAIARAGGHILRTLTILNFVVLLGGQFLRRVFSIVADSKSSEAFTSAVLLTVLGTAWLTDELGLSMTMGAFLAGVLLAESSFRSRIAVDTEPFRGLFLGLFFITTGMSMDLSLFLHAPGQVLFLISALIFWKASTVTLLGLPFGLSLAESVRVGLLLSQGGEFAFVLFALANRLGLLPDDINAFLVTTVVASMALTPALYESGRYLAPRLDRIVERSGGTATIQSTIDEYESSDSSPVVIFGYGPVGRVVGRMLSRKFIRWVAVDINRSRVKKATESGLPCIYGDSCRAQELMDLNGLKPCAFVLTHTEDSVMIPCLESIRASFPTTPVYVRARDVNHQKKLLSLGANATYPEKFETSLQLGEAVLKAFGTSDVDIKGIKLEVRGDSGLGTAFEEYERWFQENMITPSVAGSVNDSGHTFDAQDDAILKVVKPDTFEERDEMGTKVNTFSGHGKAEINDLSPASSSNNRTTRGAHNVTTEPTLSTAEPVDLMERKNLHREHVAKVPGKKSAQESSAEAM